MLDISEKNVAVDEYMYTLKKWYLKIQQHRAENRFVYDQPMTPHKLIGEIVDKLDADKSAKIAVIWTVEMAAYLERDGFCDITVLTDKYDNTVEQWCVKIIGCEYKTLDQVKEKNMKFDVVVGNPPYQNGTHKAKKNSLWKEFLESATTLADTVALVIPASFTAPSPTFSVFKAKVHTINFDVKKHFPKVGSSFCYVLWNSNHNGNCTVITKTETLSLSLDNFDCLPETINSELLSQCADVFKNNRTWERTCEYHTQNTEWVDDNGSITVMHGAATKKTNTVHENNKKIRVYCPTTTYPTFRVAHNVGLSQNQVWTECADITEANKLVEFLNSDEVQTVLKHFKWSNMYYPQTIAKLGI